ncbi:MULTISPECIES: nuclease-related domain-containing protein [Streptomyces]|uniref:nuclease-related domain-containing protein n=1 Tax=Streptomyces TaxID=1883 RepID=UPI0006EB3C11|nr:MULTISPECIES: nuclease-related domain-containing protein [Streptomyces]MCF3122239.1 NERD domain-containing protein [Streptomyces arenae]
MTGLRVVPAWRHGQERLYVYQADGRSVAWYDREASRVNVLSEDREADVLDVLAPFLTGQVTVGPPPVPTPVELARLALHPDDDLAPNRPGEALHIALEREPVPARRLRADPRHRALAAEQTVGDALDALESAGWRVLHSLPLPGEARIHHLLIGPGGLFCVGTLAVRKQRVRIADPMVTVGRGEPVPLLRTVRSDAGRASFALTAEVRPVLVLVGTGAADLELAAPPRDVRVLREGDLQALARLGGVLKPADVEALHALARDRHTWRRV